MQTTNFVGWGQEAWRILPGLRLPSTLYCVLYISSLAACAWHGISVRSWEVLCGLEPCCPAFTECSLCAMGPASGWAGAPDGNTDPALGAMPP